MFSTATGSGQIINNVGVHHHFLLPAIAAIWQGILQECQVSNLACQRVRVEAVGVTVTLVIVAVIQAFTSAVNVIASLK